MQVQPRLLHSAKEKAAVKSWLILAMCFAYLIYFFSSSYYFQIFLTVLSIVVFFTSLTSAKPAPRVLGFIMMLVGVILNFIKGSGVEGTMDGILSNLPLLTLVILVPLISIPFKIGGFFHSVHYFLEILAQDSRKMFGSITVFLFCMGPILNIGSIRVLHEMIQDLKLRSILLAKAYLVGFSTVILWSPYFASVAMVLYYLDLSVTEYLPYGLTLAFIQLLVGNGLFQIWYRNHKEEANSKSDQEATNPKQIDIHQNKIHRKKMMKLFLIVVGLFCSIFLIEHLTKWPMLVLVSLTSLLFPLLWGLFQREWGEMRYYFGLFRDFSVPTMNNEIVMFIGAGVFGKALVGTTIADGIQVFLNQVAGTSFMLFIYTVLLILLVFTFIGLHQIVVVTVLLTQFDPVALGTTPQVLALLLMVGWSMSAVLSPVNPLNLLVSSSVNEPSLAVGMKWNGVYLFSMFVIGSLFIYFLH
ncbi:hypothetical protein [Ammoniphilus resinae]|uniref:Uncharacterized protein n=1 Tax=Ammoniphilus resinae TaxID=861532 RepID=A0ABS4GVG9_9BACL|nr:hypothetical protein [Ammoniphilus resinae]MBP1933880.1 hypothetical protein [Ammoniphilus resinae]